MDNCLIILLLWALFGIVGYYIGQKKGINPVLGVVAGVLLGPLVFLMLFVSQEKQIKKCPQCAESIKYEAKVCKHCGFNFAEI